MINTGRRNIVPFSGILLVALLFTISSTLNAQKERGVREDPPPLSERFFFGGSFALQIGSFTDIEIAPVAGLWVLPRVAVAAGPSYRFYKFLGNRTDILGIRTYSQLVLLRDIDKFIPIGVHSSIFIHLEDELLSLETDFWKIPSTDPRPRRFYVNTPLAGAGISQQIGRRSSVNFMVLWALYDSGYPLYSNPEIRVSFVF